MKSILDRSFQYTPSTQTDLKRTFSRIRREEKAKREEQEAAEAFALVADDIMEATAAAAVAPVYQPPLRLRKVG